MGAHHLVGWGAFRSALRLLRVSRLTTPLGVFPERGGLREGRAMHIATVLRSRLTALTLAFASSGCSLIFVKPPPRAPLRPVDGSPTACTSSKLAPVLDTLGAGLEGVRIAYAATAPDSVYADPKQPLSRAADIGLGVGFAALFVGSAIYGYGNTARCARLKADTARQPSRQRLSATAEPAVP
jgi:hypothetical protein